MAIWSDRLYRRRLIITRWLVFAVIYLGIAHGTFIPTVGILAFPTSVIIGSLVIVQDTGIVLVLRCRSCSAVARPLTQPCWWLFGFRPYHRPKAIYHDASIFQNSQGYNQSMSIFPADSHQGLKTIACYLLSILVSVLWTMVLIQFRESINPHTIAMLYLIPVLTNTALWGLGPGVTTASLAFLAFNYYFLPPYHSFTVHQWQDIFILLVFLIISFIISNLIGRSKKSLAKAVQPRTRAKNIVRSQHGTQPCFYAGEHSPGDHRP